MDKLKTDVDLLFVIVDELNVRLLQSDAEITRLKAESVRLKQHVEDVDFRTNLIDTGQDKLIRHLAQQLDLHADAINGKRLEQLDCEVAH